MLHVVTVHHQSDVWIEPQTRYLRRFAPADTEVWASLDGIEHGRGFDHETTLDGSHAVKLNTLADRVSEAARPDDHLLFLDGDAFPVAPLAPLLDAPDQLTAVRRDENLGDPQPHPCFCLTTVGHWNAIGGDWSIGPPWTNSRGQPTTDVGGELLRVLREQELPWRPLTRLNTRDLQPLLFAIYGDPVAGPVVYHHGAGFRAQRGGRVRTKVRPAILPRSVPLLGRAERSIRWRNAERRRHSSWYRRKVAGQDERVRGWIAEDDNIVTRVGSPGG
jgi:hypothetical protein